MPRFDIYLIAIEAPTGKYMGELLARSGHISEALLDQPDARAYLRRIVYLVAHKNPDRSLRFSVAWRHEARSHATLSVRSAAERPRPKPAPGEDRA